MNVAILLRGLASVIWLIVIGLIALAILRASRRQNVKALSTTILILVLAGVLLTTISAGLVFIQPEERGVVISAVAPKGYREQPLEPGLNWIVPFLESVVRYPISRQTYTMSMIQAEGQVQGDDSITARTSDGQEVFVDASVIYSVDPEKVITVHIEWQDRYSSDLVRPLARGIIRDAISQFGVEEVYSSKRSEMTRQIEEIIGEKLTENGLVLVDFILRNITFSPEYAASVEQKQIAEQLAQQARFVVEQRKQEAEQARQVARGQADSAVIQAEGQAEARIIQANAESEALQLIRKAIEESSELLTYTYINKLAPGVQVMLVPSNAPFLLPLPTMNPSILESTDLLPTAVPTPTPSASPTPTITP